MANLKYADFPEERKVRERERARQWRADNPELTRAYDQKKSARISAERKAFRLANPIVRLTKEERLRRKRACCRRWHAENREYLKEKRRERYQANPGRDKAVTRQSSYKKKYGITIAEYDAMLATQKGCCAICGADKPGGKGRWCVDHCGKTGIVRQLLCNCCNPGLGFFKHNIDLLQRAIDYLKAHQQSR